VGRLDDAAKAYRASDAALRRAEEQATARVQAAREARTNAREELAEAIAAEARTGTPQVEIIRRSGYSREQVRRILRAAGVEPG
jgi:hypothetical protein